MHKMIALGALSQAICFSIIFLIIVLLPEHDKHASVEGVAAKERTWQERESLWADRVHPLRSTPSRDGKLGVGKLRLVKLQEGKSNESTVDGTASKTVLEPQVPDQGAEPSIRQVEFQADAEIIIYCWGSASNASNSPPTLNTDMRWNCTEPIHPDNVTMEEDRNFHHQLATLLDRLELQYTSSTPIIARSLWNGSNWMDFPTNTDTPPVHRRSVLQRRWTYRGLRIFAWIWAALAMLFISMSIGLIILRRRRIMAGRRRMISTAPYTGTGTMAGPGHVNGLEVQRDGAADVELADVANRRT